MDTKRMTFTKDQLRFIRYMAGKVESSPELNGKMDECIEKLNKHSVGTMKSNKELENIRDGHRPTLTADFLSLFGSPSGLKFLTHDFDPGSGMTMATVIYQVHEILSSEKFYKKLPDSLYPLISRFVYGGDEWYDYNHNGHNVSLSTGGLKDWIDAHPTFHPITSPDFGQDIQQFRNTVRISKPLLPKLITSLVERSPKFQNLNIQTERLDKADFYTNVDRMINYIIERVLSDISQRDRHAKVRISFDRASWDVYRLCQISITHIGSEANLFDEVREKFMNGGGAMFEIAKCCQGYCDWTIEGNFEGECKRWRILSAQPSPEIENLQCQDIDGFKHILTFYKQ